MVNTRGELTEVTRATLAVKVDGTWCTPPPESGCLPGVERARLLDLGVLHERVLRRTDLDTARRAGGDQLTARLAGRPSAHLRRRCRRGGGDIAARTVRGRRSGEGRYGRARTDRRRAAPQTTSLSLPVATSNTNPRT